MHFKETDTITQEKNIICSYITAKYGDEYECWPLCTGSLYFQIMGFWPMKRKNKCIKLTMSHKPIPVRCLFNTPFQSISQYFGLILWQSFINVIIFKRTLESFPKNAIHPPEKKRAKINIHCTVTVSSFKILQNYYLNISPAMKTCWRHNNSQICPSNVQIYLSSVALTCSLTLVLNLTLFTANWLACYKMTKR